MPTDDPKQRKPDISKARETLGWEPACALRDGLVKTNVYFDQLLRMNERLEALMALRNARRQNRRRTGRRN